MEAAERVAADVDQPRQVGRSAADREVSRACDAGTRASVVRAAGQIQHGAGGHVEAAAVRAAATEAERAGFNLH